MRILLVDDDPDVRQMLTIALTKRGHDVLQLPNAFGVMSAVAKGKIDLLILDLYMPLLSGRDSLDLLAKDERTRSVPVVLFSAVQDSVMSDVAAAHPRVRSIGKGSLRELLDVVDELASARADLRRSPRVRP